MQKEQNAIEKGAGSNYPEPGSIEKECEDLYNECKKMVDTAKQLRQQIDGVKKGPPKDVGVSMHPIVKGIIKLDKSILTLAENLEKLAQKVLKNGEDLISKGKFTPELKAKCDKVGKSFENIGGRLKSIGKNFGVISDKCSSIGDKLDGFDGEKMKEYAKQLKELADKTIEKGGSVEQLGIKIQKLAPNQGTTPKPAGNNENAKDLEQIQQDLGDIAKDLENMIKVSYFS